MDNQKVMTVIDELSTLNKRVNKSLSKARKAIETWDLNTLEKALASIREDAKLRVVDYNEKLSEVAFGMQQKRDYLNSNTYAEMLEKSLKATGIPLNGEFPRYELIPFKLMIDTEQGFIRLSIGRKNQKTTVFAPSAVATWVAAKYKALMERKFDSKRFCKELLEAYKIGNKIAYGNAEILWGRAVPLSLIYELLTVRRSARLEYPKEIFSYELGQLKEQVEIKYQNYKFDFGFARQQSNSLLITDSQGRESRLSSLIIYEEDK